MVKTNRPGSQKAGTNDTSINEKQQEQAASSPALESANAKKTGKPGGKSRSTVGGTAVQGAKSTQPKEVSTGAQANQQAEYYNREMRRRMQQMGTGPYSDRAAVDPRERRRKRKERLQERQQKMKQTVDAKGPSRDIKLGRRNTYFLIGTVAVLIILFIIFLIIRHPF
jgi:hypothetical protein